VLRDEDLVGGVNNGRVEAPTLDLGDAVERGSEHHEERGGDGLNDDGAAAALDPIQCDDD